MYSRSLLYAEDKGEVKLSADPKTAEVYIDGAYAGKADQLRTMWLDSGAYDLSLSAKGRVASGTWAFSTILLFRFARSSGP
jgi:hypothetical protein